MSKDSLHSQWGFCSELVQQQKKNSSLTWSLKGFGSTLVQSQEEGHINISFNWSQSLFSVLLQCDPKTLDNAGQSLGF